MTDLRNKYLDRDLKQIEENTQTLRSRFTPAERPINEPFTPVSAEQARGQGAVTRGLRAGVDDIYGTANVIQAAMADTDEETLRELDEAKAYFERAASRRKGKSISNIESVGDFGTLVGEQFGAMIPSIATAVAGGGVFGIAAKKLTTTLAKKAVMGAGAAIGSGLGQGGEHYRNMALEGPERNAIEQQMGRTVEGEVAQKTGGGTPGFAEQFIGATGGALGAGALELVPLIRAFRKSGLPGEASKLVRALKRGGETALAETGTELLQTGLQRSVQKYMNVEKDVFSEEGIEEFLTAAAVAPVIGGPIGFVGSYVSDTVADAGPKVKALSSEHVQELRNAINEYRQANGGVPLNDSFRDSLDVDELFQNTQLKDGLSEILGTDAEAIAQENELALEEGDTVLEPVAKLYNSIVKSTAHYTDNALFPKETLDSLSLNDTAAIKKNSLEGSKLGENQEFAPMLDMVDEDARIISPNNPQAYKDVVAQSVYERMRRATPQGRVERHTTAIEETNAEKAKFFKQEADTFTELSQSGLNDIQMFDMSVNGKIAAAQRTIDRHAKAVEDGAVDLANALEGMKLEAEKVKKFETKRLNLKPEQKAAYVKAVVTGAMNNMTEAGPNTPYSVKSQLGFIKEQQSRLNNAQKEAQTAPPMPTFEELGGTDGLLSTLQVKRSKVREPAGQKGVVEMDPDQVLARPTDPKFGIITGEPMEGGVPAHNYAGVPQNINAQPLTMAVLRRMSAETDMSSMTDIQKLGEAFQEGIAMLADQHKIVADKIPDTAVIFQSRNAKITFGHYLKEQAKGFQSKLGQQSLLADEFVGVLDNQMVDPDTGEITSLTDENTGLQAVAIDKAPPKSVETRQVERKTSAADRTQARFNREAALKRLGQLFRQEDAGFPLSQKEKQEIRDLKTRIEHSKVESPDTFNAKKVKFVDKQKEADLKKFTNPDAVNKKVVRFIDEITKALGIKDVDVVTTTEYYDEFIASRADKDTYLEMFREGRAGGATFVSGGRRKIWVNPNGSPAKQLVVAAHEVGHIVFQNQFENASIDTQRALLKDWQDSVEAKIGKEQFAELTREGAGFKTPSEVPRAIYKHSFEEWVANQVSQWITTDKKPKSVVEKFFRKVADTIERIWNYLQDRDGLTPAKSIDEWVSSLWYSQNADIYHDTLVKDEAYIKENKPTDAGAKKIFKEIEENNHLPVDWWVLITSKLNMNNFKANIEGFMEVYEHVLNKNERDVVMKFTDSFFVRNQVYKAVDDPALIAQVDNDPRMMAAVAFVLHKQGAISLGQNAHGIFTKVMNTVAKVFGIITNANRAASVYDFMLNAPLADKHDKYFNPRIRIMLPKQLENTMIQRVTKNVRPVIEYGFSKINNLIMGSYAQFSKNAYSQKVLRTLHNDITRKNQDTTYTEGRDFHYSKFSRKLHDVFEALDYDEDLMLELHEALAANELSKASPEVRKAGKMLNEVLADMHIYAKRSGLDIGHIKDYYPLVFDQDLVAMDRMNVQAILDKYLPDAVLENAYNQYLKNRVPNDFGPPVTKEAFRPSFLASIVDNIVGNDGLADIYFHELKQNPLMNAIETRSLKWLTDIPEARKEIAQYQRDNVAHTMAIYMKQLVRRAEYARVYGEKGEKLSKMLDEARENGVSEREITQIEDILEGALGVRGANFALHHPKMNKFIQVMSVFQAMRTLGTAIFSNLSDIVGLTIRGDMVSAMQSFKDGIKDTIKGGHSRELAEDLGAVNRAFVSELLASGFEGTNLTGKAQRVSDWFFTINGLEGWTRLTRTMGAALAERMFYRWSQNPEKHKADFEEMNISPDDLQFTEDGDLIRASSMTQDRWARELATNTKMSAKRREYLESELAKAQKIDMALNRFINTAMLRPDAISRPNWANSPQFHLFFQLKGFMYKFWDVYHRRAFHEMMHNNNLRPLGNMLWFVPMYMMGEFLRDVVQHGGEDDPRKRDWDFIDTLGYASENSGVFGMGEYGLNLADDFTYNKIPGESSAGPSVQWFLDGIRATTGHRSMDNFVMKSLPGQSVYRYWGED